MPNLTRVTISGRKSQAAEMALKGHPSLYCQLIVLSAYWKRLALNEGTVHLPGYLACSSYNEKHAIPM